MFSGTGLLKVNAQSPWASPVNTSHRWLPLGLSTRYNKEQQLYSQLYKTLTFLFVENVSTDIFGESSRNCTGQPSAGCTRESNTSSSYGNTHIQSSPRVDFHCRVILTCVRTQFFARVNKVEAMHGSRSRVNAKVEPRSTFTFTRGLSYITSILFTRVKFTCVRTRKLRDSGNPP